jgi:hypothetical protein
MVKKKDYLVSLYWNGCDKRDPMNLPYWFGGLLEDGHVKVHNNICLVSVTEKGLNYIEKLGFIQELESQANSCMHL